MLELVDKYSHFTYPPKVYSNGTNGHVTGTSGKVVCTRTPLTHGVFNVAIIPLLDRLDGRHGLSRVVHTRRAPQRSGRGDCLLSLSCQERRGGGRPAGSVDEGTKVIDTVLKSAHQACRGTRDRFICGPVRSRRGTLPRDRESSDNYHSCTYSYPLTLSSLHLDFPYLVRPECLAGQFQPRHFQVRIYAHILPSSRAILLTL